MQNDKAAQKESRDDILWNGDVRDQIKFRYLQFL
jgi:hypothetical protein